MKRNIFLILQLIVAFLSVNGQQKEINPKELRFGVGFGASDPIIIFNGERVDTSIYKKIVMKDIGSAFVEGDSLYLRKIHDSSILAKYFGNEINRGILFIYTKDKITRLSYDELIQLKEKNRYLIKIDSSPFSFSNGELNKIPHDSILKIVLIPSNLTNVINTPLLIVKTN